MKRHVCKKSHKEVEAYVLPEGCIVFLHIRYLYCKLPVVKHIVIDARIRQSSTGRYIDRLIEHLQQIDKENKYTILLKPGDPWEPSAQNFTTKICPYPNFTFNPLPLFSYGLFLKKLRPDLVHFAMTPLEPLWYFGDRITTTHDLTMLRFTRPGERSRFAHEVGMLGYRFMFWISHRLAKHVIVPSKFVADDLIKLHPFTKEKVSVTYEASEPPLGTKATQPRRVKTPFILHVGSPFPHKNIDVLVEAFTLLKQTNPVLQLVLPGKKEQYFEKLEAHLESHPYKEDIIIPGFVSDEELEWLYQNAEAYVLPSLSEGFGLPGLEAMSHGCPLISSNATCMPEVYGEAAHYFDPTSSNDIAQAVNEVISSEQKRRDLIQKGYIQLKKYSWDKMAHQTLGVYRGVLKD
jgi:glycosyltransferase involved in cell wall biosynthesis